LGQPNRVSRSAAAGGEGGGGPDGRVLVPPWYNINVYKVQKVRKGLSRTIDTGSRDAGRRLSLGCCLLGGVGVPESVAVVGVAVGGGEHRRLHLRHTRPR
jgi:hypothetical protein